MTAIGIWFIVIGWLGTRLRNSNWISEFWGMCWAGVFLAGALLIAGGVSLWAWEVLP
ncbi:hypothetical protein ACV22V_08080 [Burkholderia sp. AW33-5]